MSQNLPKDCQDEHEIKLPKDFRRITELVNESGVQSTKIDYRFEAEKLTQANTILTKLIETTFKEKGKLERKIFKL